MTQLVVQSGTYISILTQTSLYGSGCLYLANWELFIGSYVWISYDSLLYVLLTIFTLRIRHIINSFIVADISYCPIKVVIVMKINSESYLKLNCHENQLWITSKA